MGATVSTADARRPPVHRFADWELHVHDRTLLVHGRAVKIGRPAFGLLLALIEGRGGVVDKNDLIAAAWPGRVVEENNLSVQISALRKLLGPQSITNVSGLGYRLAVAPLADAGPAPAAADGPDDEADLLGRATDLVALTAALQHAPLVTIVGTGGVGKTTLARAIVARLHGAYRDGTHWIDLSALRPGTPLLPAIANELGVLPSGARQGAVSDELVLALAPLRPLIVLDNCEHLLAEVGACVASLLQRAPGLRWLATSQEPLRVDGETCHRLAPLDLPRPGAPLNEALGSPALALFCERAARVDRHFQLRPERLALAVELCRRLDGLPLAIEMAAARVATLGIDGVHAQLGQQLRLRSTARDAPVRQHTLRHTYDWSYGLLSPAEQRAFRRLQPFAGGFTAALAQNLCAPDGRDGAGLDGWDMADALGALVDKSLVQRAPPLPGHDGVRLHLLESARDYARLQLDRLGETEAARRRHAEVVADAYDTAHPDLDRLGDAAWIAKYAVERINVAEALAWACGGGDPALLARLVTALAVIDRMALPQGDVARHPIPLDVLAQAPPPLRARARAELGTAFHIEGVPGPAVDLLREAAADYEALGDAAGLHFALTRLIRVCLETAPLKDEAAVLWERLRGIDERQVPLRQRLRCAVLIAFHFDNRQRLERVRQLLRVAERAGYDSVAAACRLNATDELLRQERYAEAAQAAEKQDGAEPTLRVPALIAYNRALALVRLGRLAEAEQAAASVIRALPNAAHLVMDLHANAAAQDERWEDAALIAGRSAEIKRAQLWRAEPAEASLIADTERRLHEALGAPRCAALMGFGAAMSDLDVFALARRETAASV